MKRSSLEVQFAQVWRMLGNGLPDYEEQHRFHPPRRWKVDCCWPDRKVAVELEGGVWTNGRHTRGSGFLADLEKYNQLTIDGFKLLRFTATNLTTDPAGCVEAIRQLLRDEHEKRPE